MPLHLNPPSDTYQLTRRSFLALCVAGCSRIIPPLPQPRREQTWALISDTHVSATLDHAVRGSPMAHNLKNVVDDVVSTGADHVLFNGDVALAKGRIEDYAAFQDLISPLRSRGTPLHLTLGNHDHRARFVESLALAPDASLSDKTVSSMSVGGHQWLFLDSLDKVNGLRGSLGPEQRAWLVRRLDADPAPAIVCLHHHPDNALVGLKDSRDFLDIVVPRRQVKLVLFGHTHQYRVWQNEGLHFVNLPATGFRFLPDTSLGWVLARFTDRKAQIEFRGITPGEPNHGAIRNLPWRADA